MRQSLLTTYERLPEGCLKSDSSVEMVRPCDVVSGTYSTEAMLMRAYYQH